MRSHGLSLVRGIILALGLVALGACSNHWREADLDLSPAELGEIMDQLESEAGASSVGSVADVLALRQLPGTIIYYGDAPSPIGPVASVLSLYSLDFLGASVDVSEVSEARVFFFDAIDNGVRRFGLIVGLKQGDGGFSYYGLSGNGEVSDGRMEARLGDGSVILRSWDVEGSELSTVIQLRVYIRDGNQEYYNGKFSTLVGFYN